MEVEVVARQVGEHNDCEVDADRAVQRQRMGTGLHGTGLIARIGHLAEHALQVQRLGRSEFDGRVDAADTVDDGAEQTGA